MTRKYFKIFLLAIVLLNLFASCKSIRQSSYIEKRFLLAKVNDSVIIKDKMPYEAVLVKYVESGYSLPTFKSAKSTKWSSIDITINDTVNNNRFALDDRKAVFEFLKKDTLGIQYVNEFKRKKTTQKIHRYTSISAMISGIFIMSKYGGDDSNPTKQEIRMGNTGGYLLTAGFLNWIGGAFGRAVNRRPVPMKAMYHYYFGPLPKKIPRVSRAEKKQIIKLFKSF
jgi:hypothetical protein